MIKLRMKLKMRLYNRSVIASTLKLYKIIICMLLLTTLNGCMSNVFTGANLIYDRHNVYMKFDDVQLSSAANRIMFRDKLFKCSECMLDVVTFNRDILLVGTVPKQTLRVEALKRLQRLQNSRRIFNQLYVNSPRPNTLQDSFITLAVRSYIFANSKIDPHAFKIVTWGGVVYLIGDVMPEQAELVTNYAKNFAGVVRVVTLFKYYHLTDS